MVTFDAEGFATDLRKEFQKEIVRLELIDTGLLLSSFNVFKIENNKIIFTLPDYAEALEFGTYSLGETTSETMPNEDSSVAYSLKKKNLPPEIAKKLGKGMVSFSFIRRVIYNENLMQELVQKNIH